MGQITYNVLWVDDDDRIVDAYRQDADAFNLYLDRVSNWDDAEDKLNADFEEYSAIILDAKCIVHRGDLIKDNFISSILPKLSKIFENKHLIPWYILSAGTAKDLEGTKEVANENRKAFEPEWGPMYYLKDAKDGDPEHKECLFRKIAEVAEKSPQNSILQRYEKVFSYLGEGRLIDSGEARTTLLEMLDAFYSPEDNRKFRYKGNDLRVIFQCVFEPARKHGLLPDECFVNGNVNIKAASDFMAGKNIDCYENGKFVYKLRWGRGVGKEGDGKGCDSIFSPFTAKCVENMRNYANESSHEYVNENTRDLYFGYVMHLCQAIRNFGEFVKEHPNVEENRKMHRNPDLNYNIKDILDKDKWYVYHGESGLLVASCKLSSECQKLVKVGDNVKIEEVVENSGSDKFFHPFVATKITLVAKE